MIIDEFKEQTSLMYETVREIFQDRLQRLDEYIAVYKENQELADLTDEEWAEILPLAIENQAQVKQIVEKLNQTVTRDWFIELVNNQLESSVSVEEAEVLTEALKVQTKIDSVYQNGSAELVSYLTKDIGDKVVIN